MSLYLSNNFSVSKFLLRVELAQRKPLELHYVLRDLHGVIYETTHAINLEGENENTFLLQLRNKFAAIWDGQTSLEKLKDLSMNLSNVLLPQGLMKSLGECLERYSEIDLSIQLGDPFLGRIPWGLLWCSTGKQTFLQRRSQGGKHPLAKSRFLCVLAHVSIHHPEQEKALNVQLKRGISDVRPMLIQDAYLTHHDELAAWEELPKTSEQITFSEWDLLETFAYSSKPKANIVHVAYHLEVEPHEDLNVLPKLRLGEQKVRIDEFRTLLEQIAEDNPFVFLNGCSSDNISGHSVISTTACGMLATHTAACVGTWGNVYSFIANDMADAFYSYLFAGKPGSEALFLARLDVANKYYKNEQYASAYLEPLIYFYSGHGDLELKKKVPLKKKVQHREE